MTTKKAYPKINDKKIEQALEYFAQISTELSLTNGEVLELLRRIEAQVNQSFFVYIEKE